MLAFPPVSAQQVEGLKAGTVIAGRYRVEQKLGQGGMGSVFLVQHVHTDERLALKLLHSTVVTDQATLDRFRREARTPARIDSDHVVRVTDADVAPELDNVPFLVMEYLRGEDLEHLASRRGTLPPSEVVLLLAQAARGLDKAHTLGIVHRDLKPENLFITQREDGTPNLKILDFGIAKMTGQSDVKEAGKLTATGQIFGTPLYMSPEQAMAESEKISPQTDVWALGLIAHRLLTGKEFWTASTLTHLVAQIAFEPIPPPSERGCTLGAAYDEWFGKCVARDPSVRFKSAGEAVSALAASLRVTDSPSQLARLPMSVRIGTSSTLADDRDALADTRASEGVTAPSSNGKLPQLGRTQFSGEAAKPQRPKTLGLVAVSAVAVLIGGALAWKFTSPGDGGVGAATSDPQTPPATARATGPAPTVTPAIIPSGEITVTQEPAPTTTAASTKPPVGGTSAPKPTTPVPTAKPTSAPSTAPTAAPTAAPTTAPKDPLGTRR
ncbi:MAG: protein kinase [Polyangiaceae bacterium]|nr:protein kinase [Polyangiaceae bacterium]